MAKTQKDSRRRLIKEVVCPHCWTQFPPENTLWISEEPTLIGDFKLTENDPIRFLPHEFDEHGAALDAKGFPCKDFACPFCHQRIPTPALDSPSVFMSIVGAPSCGKSYYLASSTYALRRTLSQAFNLNYTDADPIMNVRLQDYESQQFIGSDTKLVKLEKTEEQGDLYDKSLIGGQQFIFPQPFTFLAAPGVNHPNFEKSSDVARMICLYDNAGESYLPKAGADTTTNPVTRHLAHSGCIFFLFDPIQDPRFRRECQRVSNDPQLGDNASAYFRTNPNLRQETIFGEMVKRVRAYRHMGTNERYPNPVVISVSKVDVWRGIAPRMNLNDSPIRPLKYKEYNINALRLDYVREASDAVRRMLQQYTPEFVMAVESFAEDVVYIPVSATGVSPTVDPITHASGFRAIDMKPIWIEIPMLYALSRMTKGLVVSLPNDRIAEQSQTTSLNLDK